MEKQVNLSPDIWLNLRTCTFLLLCCATFIIGYFVNSTLGERLQRRVLFEEVNRLGELRLEKEFRISASVKSSGQLNVEDVGIQCSCLEYLRAESRPDDQKIDFFFKFNRFTGKDEQAMPILFKFDNDPKVYRTALSVKLLHEKPFIPNFSNVVFLGVDESYVYTVISEESKEIVDLNVLNSSASFIKTHPDPRGIRISLDRSRMREGAFRENLTLSFIVGEKDQTLVLPVSGWIKN
jgi:hypothetical protein